MPMSVEKGSAMRFWLVILCMSTLATTAGAASLPKSTYATVYSTKVLRDVNAAQIIKTNIKNRLFSACPHVTNKSVASCFRVQIQSTQIQSVSQLTVLGVLAALASASDIKSGQNRVTAQLQLAENLLFLLEKVKAENFHLNEFQMVSTTDYLQVVLLKQSEQRAYAKTLKTMIDSIDKSLGAAGPPVRAPSSATPPDLQVWQTNQLKKLTERAEAARTRTALYSPDETAFQRARILKYHGDETSQGFCSQPVMAQCKDISPLACESIMHDSFQFCDSQLTLASRTFAKPADVVNYMKKLESCVIPRFSSTVAKTAPNCR